MFHFKQKQVGKGCVIENSKKITKKLKKLKNTVGASFQAKIRSKKAVKERENKNYPSVPFLPHA